MAALSRAPASRRRFAALHRDDAVCERRLSVKLRDHNPNGMPAGMRRKMDGG